MEVVEDYSKNNCRYLEIRSTPKNIGEIDKEIYVETVLEALEEAEAKFGVRTAYIVSINRTAPVQSCSETIDLAIKMKKLDGSKYKKIVGIEMSGDPRKGNFQDFVEEF